MGGVWNATQDENTVTLKQGEQSEIGEKIKECIEKQIIERSSADEIIKFKQLLDMGVITSEEFDAKKKQLLGL